MTAWFLYSLLVGGALSAAAVAGERLMAAFRRPVRHVWIVTLGATALAPVAAFLWRRFGAAAPDVSHSGGPLDGVLLNAWEITASSPVMPAVQRILLAGWIIASTLLLLRMASGWRQLRLTMRDWRNAAVDGVPVLVSEQIGPAVLGVHRGRIVLPRWALELDAPLRALVIRHEEEHCHARDPLALFAATLVCALFPWHLALWWQAARLRLAIEMDCDARVLRSHPEVERYGLLLLAIAQQRSTLAPVPAAALTEPRSLLERRISAMSSLPSRRPTTLVALSLLVAGGILLACAAPSPDASTEPSKPADVSANKSGPTPVSEPMREFQVETPVTAKLTSAAAPRYPDSLREAKIEGSVLAQFVVNRDGTPDVGTFKVLKSDHDLFTQAVKKSLPNMQFTPALVGGKPVRQLVEMPFTFSLTKSER